MGKAPERCPMCGERQNWKLVDTANKGFSVVRHNLTTAFSVSQSFLISVDVRK